MTERRLAEGPATLTEAVMCGHDREVGRLPRVGFFALAVSAVAAGACEKRVGSANTSNSVASGDLCDVCQGRCVESGYECCSACLSPPYACGPAPTNTTLLACNGGTGSASFDLWFAVLSVLWNERSLRGQVCANLPRHGPGRSGLRNLPRHGVQRQLQRGVRRLRSGQVIPRRIRPGPPGVIVLRSWPRCRVRWSAGSSAW